jgi:hypothetical protein
MTLLTIANREMALIARSVTAKTGGRYPLPLLWVLAVTTAAGGVGVLLMTGSARQVVAVAGTGSCHRFGNIGMTVGAKSNRRIALKLYL